MSDEYDVLIEISADDVKKATEERDNRNAEITRLREMVKGAYFEGWQDSASREYSSQEINRDWETSEACAAIREGGKDG